MVKDDLVKRSPVRLFEKKISGGLLAGEIGVIASPKGIGKTSVIVQIALDKLLQGKKIIHISFNQHSDYVMNWYEHIFDEFTKKKNLENEKDIKEELVSGRILMNFNQEGVNSDVIRASLRSIIVDGGYKADAIINDGFDFSIAKSDRLATLKEFAKSLGISVWYSCSLKNLDTDKNHIPNVLKDFQDVIDVLINLEAKQSWT
jgi:archaellum biogenesis ATPase FlaH